MSETTCGTTTDGHPICARPAPGAASACGCNSNVSLAQPAQKKSESAWAKIRGGVMFGVACVTSPCCTPLIVPVALVLLAGTPIAVWLSANLGWVYGGLTLVSAISLVLAVRWWGKHSPGKRPTQNVPASKDTLNMESIQ